MAHSLTSHHSEDLGDFREVKEVIVTSGNLAKNRLICTLLESGWVLLDVQVRERRKCSEENRIPSDVDYRYLLGRPMEAASF